ncbi:MAG: TlpA family protein disulfide reductase [Chloroflexi bacterium]|nr:TlpA family protein disulfide reductase [Chloroflexota bacterium]
MTKKSKYRKRKKDNSGLVAMGIGLILIGIALFIFWPRANTASGSTLSADEMSVVPAAVNYPAPQLALQNVNGTNESLSDFRQDVLLVNNWATWCPPCKAEMPTLEAYYEAHAAEGFMIVAIEAGEPKDSVSQFAQSYGLKFHVWADPQNASLSVFRNDNLPNSYVIDRTGTVRYAWTGAISRAMLEKYVTPLLTQSN